jgi:hypothetical protein
MVGEVDINWIPEFRSSFCWAGKSVLGGLWQLPFPDDPVSKVSFRLGQFGTAANFLCFYLQITVIIIIMVDLQRC